MFDILRDNPWKAALILLIPLTLSVLYMTHAVLLTLDQNDSYIGAVLDDTWIHVRFAYHISQGEGLAFNEGVVTPGATSPLWVLVMGGVFALTDPGIDQQLHIAIGMSAIGNALTVLAITAFGWWATRRAWIGLLAGVITALTGRMVWMGLSGMEITTFTALCIIALWSHMADLRAGRVFGWRTGILAALATLGRPEGYLLAALIGLDAFILAPLRAEGFGGLRRFYQRVIPGWRGIVAYVLLAGSYPLACLLMTGHPLPNTFRAKSQLGREWPDLPYAYLWEPNVDFGPLFIALMLLGIGFLLWLAFTRHDAEIGRIGFAWALWPVAFVLAVLYLGAQHYVVNNSRYVVPAIPFNILAAVVGIWAVSAMLRRFTPSISPLVRERLVPGLLAVALIGFAFVFGYNQAPRVAHDVGQLRRMHVAAGEWLADATEPGQMLALNDVGAITHITDREVLDLVGLVSPQVIDEVQDVARGTCNYDLQLARLMLDNPPDLIGVFPWWFPCMTDWEGALQPFNVFAIQGTTVIAGGELVIYWPMWENWPLREALPPEVTPVEAQFEQGITLAAYQATPTEGGLEVELWWQADEQPQGDYTVFVHLIDADGQIITQRDTIPQGGQMQTSWWRAGDLIPDERTLDVPDLTVLDQDGVALRIGFYPTGGGTNLLRQDGDETQPDYVLVPLG